MYSVYIFVVDLLESLAFACEKTLSPKMLIEVWIDSPRSAECPDNSKLLAFIGGLRGLSLFSSDEVSQQKLKNQKAFSDWISQWEALQFSFPSVETSTFQCLLMTSRFRIHHSGCCSSYISYKKSSSTKSMCYVCYEEWLILHTLPTVTR